MTAATEPLAVLSGVGKRYGDTWAVLDMSLEIRPGQIVGFIGPNGAGKTTLMKLIAGLCAPTRGSLNVLGQRLDNSRQRTPAGLGLSTDMLGMIPTLSSRENLRMLGRIRSVATPASIDDTLVRVGLDPKDPKPVRAYSTGMRQRLSLAQALMEKPRLLLLDEPTNGLDPAGVISFRQLLQELAGEGAGILLASHLLTEVERVCHQVLLVRAGRLLKSLTIYEPRPTVRRVTVSTLGDLERLRAWTAQDGEGRASLTVNGLTADVDSPLATPALVRVLLDSRIAIEAIGPAHSDLETEYLRTVGQVSIVEKD